MADRIGQWSILEEGSILSALKFSSNLRKVQPSMNYERVSGIQYWGEKVEEREDGRALLRRESAYVYYTIFVNTRTNGWARPSRGIVGRIPTVGSRDLRQIYVSQFCLLVRRALTPLRPAFACQSGSCPGLMVS